MSKKLIPVNKKQCQAMILEGSFMTFGPRSQKQCKNKNINLLVIKECDYNTQKHDIINNIKSFLKGKLETFDPNQR